MVIYVGSLFIVLFLFQLRNRYDRAMADRKQMTDAMNKNVSSDGQQLYLKISKWYV